MLFRSAGLWDVVMNRAVDGCILDIYHREHPVPLADLQRLRRRMPPLALIVYADFEHRELFKLINGLYRAKDGSPFGASDFLGRIQSAISAHFALEEKVMREAAYPAFEAHKADHEELLDEIREIMDRFDAGHFESGEADLGSVLSTWFGHHFRTHDARLHRALGGAP